MTPDFASGRNGWFENKRAFKQINYGQNGCTATGNCSLNTLDSRMETGTSNNGYAYVAPTTYYGPLPRTIPAGTSVTKVRSVGSASYCVPGDDTNCIQDISVLTVLAAPPPPNSMRPPLGGPSTQKPHFVLTGFDLATGIPNLPLLGTGAQYSWGQVNASIYNYPPFVSTFIPGEFDGRWIPNGMIKLNGQPSINYGCDTGYWLNGVILRLSQTGTVAEKQKAFYYLLNAAIDHYYAEVDGKDWGSTGCIHHGRKSLIMWGGKILNSIAANQGRAAAMAAYDGGSEAIDLATYTSSTIGEALWGYAANYGSETDPDGRRCDRLLRSLPLAALADQGQLHGRPLRRLPQRDVQDVRVQLGRVHHGARRRERLMRAEAPDRAPGTTTRRFPMSIVSLIVFLVLVGVLFWVVRTLSATFGVPAQVTQVLYVLLVIVAVLYLLQGFGLIEGSPPLRIQ
jgi:hypothetical protein